MDKIALRQKINFIRQGSEVERWLTKKMLQVNDVGHHSFHVAWFAYLIYMSYADEATNVGAQRVVMGALSHDLAEHITGDVPGDFKRELHLREQFGQYEEALFNEVGLNFWGELSEREQRIVKFADMLDGLFFIISEASLGNRRVGRVFRNYRSYADAFAPLNETEEAILEYIDELWLHYGGLLNDQWDGETPLWGKCAHKEESLKDETIMGTDESRDEMLRREAAERMSRCTCGESKDPCPVHESQERLRARAPERVEEVAARLTDVLRREETEGRATPGPQSQPPILGDAHVPEQPADDATDDRASPDNAAERLGVTANARQYGGDHYKGVGYEHWDLVLDTGMNYFQGCSTKYVTRWRRHDAGELNLLKAIHYVDKAQEAESAGRLKHGNSTYSMSNIQDFIAANKLNELEGLVIKDIIGWRWDEARSHLERLRAGYSEPEIKNERTYYSQND